MTGTRGSLRRARVPAQRQPCAGGFTAPKLAWLADHEPNIYGAIRRILLPKDYVRLRLCGEFPTDVSDASGTCRLDVAERAWRSELAAVFGVDPAWLPRPHESSAVSGHARAGAPIAAGAGDQAAGALGVGVGVGVEVIDGGGAASVLLGTSGGGLRRQRPPPVHKDALHMFCHAALERSHTMSVMLSVAGALSWAAGVLGDAIVRSPACSTQPPNGSQGPTGCCSLSTSPESAHHTRTPASPPRSRPRPGARPRSDAARRARGRRPRQARRS